MKTTLAILALVSLTSCGTNWRELGVLAGTAAIDATIPVIQAGIKPKPAKQPVKVAP